MSCQVMVQLRCIDFHVYHCIAGLWIYQQYLKEEGSALRFLQKKRVPEEGMLHLLHWIWRTGNNGPVLLRSSAIQAGLLTWLQGHTLPRSF